MTECAGCGDCCENFPLNTVERADILGKRILSDAGFSKMRKTTGERRKTAAWMATLTPVSGPTRYVDGTMRWTYSCPRFDVETRRCTDYANRPAVCRDFPHYGKLGPHKRYPDDCGRGGLSPRCSFNEDHRTMLPIVEVTNGVSRSVALRPAAVG